MLRIIIVHPGISWAISVVLISLLLGLSLHVHDQLLDEVEHLRPIDCFKVESTLTLFQVVLIVSLISDLFLLDPSDFYYFVVVNI